MVDNGQQAGLRGYEKWAWTNRMTVLAVDSQRT